MLADVLPDGFFAARATWALWLLSAGAVALMVYGADRAVTGAVRLARLLGLSKVVIGATIVSLGTTSPEAFVSVSAAFKGSPGVSMGNGVGSIICDTALIFGLCCMLTRLPKDRFLLRRQGWVQLGTGALLTGTVWVLAAVDGSIQDVHIPRWIGMAFVAMLGLYMVLSIHWARQHPEMIPDEVAEAEAGVKPGRSPAAQLGLDVALLAAGLVLVIAGSEVMIGSVTNLCLRYSVPESVMAVTLVALGTSLPELVTALAAVIKGHPALLVGNVIGADILNVLFVIGASATAVPLRVDPHFFWLDLPFMMASLLLLRVYIWLPGGSFRRWQGVPLLALYVLFTLLVVRLGTLMGSD